MVATRDQQRTNRLLVQCPLPFFHSIRLEQVAFLNVVESIQPDTALHAFADISGIVLFPRAATRSRSRSRSSDRESHAHDCCAFDRAVEHAAAGDRAHAADAERPQDQCPAGRDFHALRPQQSFQRQFDIVGHIVNDVVPTNLDPFLTRQLQSPGLPESHGRR